MPSKLGRGLDALISRHSPDDDATKISELRSRLVKVEAEYIELKDRTDQLRKKLTMEIVLGSNPDMTELRSMEGRLLDLDLEKKEILSDLPATPISKKETDPEGIVSPTERKKRSSEIDMEMIKIMISEAPSKDMPSNEPAQGTDDPLIDETDEILKDLRSLQESHVQLESVPEAKPVEESIEKEAEPSPYPDPSYVQSIKDEIHPRVTLRKLKQESTPSPVKPSSFPTRAPVIVRKLVSPGTQTGQAYVKKKLVRKVKETPAEPTGSRGELSELLRRTSAMIEEGSFDETLTLLESGIGKYGPEGDQSIICQIGSVHFEKGDLEKANDRFRQVVRMNPMNARAINNLGVILKKQKRYEESIRIINQAIEVDPNYERAWYELGCVFMEIQPPLLKEASIFLRRAIEIDPRFERAREQLRICIEKLQA